jgi:hypothetical protein
MAVTQALEFWVPDLKCYHPIWAPAGEEEGGRDVGGQSTSALRPDRGRDHLPGSPSFNQRLQVGHPGPPSLLRDTTQNSRSLQAMDKGKSQPETLRSPVTKSMNFSRPAPPTHTQLQRGPALPCFLKAWGFLRLPLLPPPREHAESAGSRPMEVLSPHPPASLGHSRSLSPSGKSKILQAQCPVSESGS